MTTLMRNGRGPSIGKTRYKCHARLERVLLVGTRSADYIRASGHNGRIQRPYTWLHPTRSLKCPIFLLHRGPSIHGTSPTSLDVRYSVAMRVPAQPVDATQA